MELNVKRSNNIVKKIAKESNSKKEAMLNTKLRGLKIKIAKDLDDILKFAEYLGFHLQDHFGAARSIAERLAR